jgi:hypothetical protein
MTAGNIIRRTGRSAADSWTKGALRRDTWT